MLETFYIYEIINNINMKTYIGKRKCPVCNLPEHDKYMGSGININHAIDKHGVENFSKRILAICHDIKTLNVLEKIFISYYKSIGKAEYNIASGGEGGNTFRYMNEEQLQQVKLKIYKGLQGHTVSDDTRRKLSIANKGKKLSKEIKDKISKNIMGKHWYNNGIVNRFSFECPDGFVKGRLKIGKTWNKGMPNSKETRIKISKANKGRKWYNNGVIQIMSRECPKDFVLGRIHTNSKSTKGYRWYTNGIDNKLCKECPNGYRLGRSISWEIYDLNSNHKSSKAEKTYEE